MRFSAKRRTVLVLVLIGSYFNMALAEQPAAPARIGPALFLDGINNVATSASNFLTGVVQRQKEILHHVADSATDIVSNAVEKPRNLLMNTALMTSNYIDSAASIGLDFKLRRLLEKIRRRMSRGFLELGIPILEPLSIDTLYLETHNPEIGELKLLVRNATIRGLTSFVVDRARVSLIGPSLAMNITIPSLYIEGHYNMTGVIGDMFHVFGDGPLTATVTDLKIFFEAVLGYSRGLFLSSFELDFNIGHIDADFGNFMGDSRTGKVMNEVIGKLLPNLIKILKPEILPRIQDFIASGINDTIYHLTMRDALSFLIGDNDIRKYPHLLQPMMT